MFPSRPVYPLDFSLLTPPLGADAFKAGLLFLEETVVRGGLPDGLGHTLGWTASIISQEWLGPAWCVQDSQTLKYVWPQLVSSPDGQISITSFTCLPDEAPHLGLTDAEPSVGTSV